MRMPETVGGLMQFLQAANWMRSDLPQFADRKAPLQTLDESGDRNVTEQWRGLGCWVRTCHSQVCYLVLNMRERHRDLF